MMTHEGQPKVESAESPKSVESVEAQVEVMRGEVRQESDVLAGQLESDLRSVTSEDARAGLLKLQQEVAAVGTVFESVATPVEAKESQEKTREAYEYRDTEGKLICRAEAEFTEDAEFRADKKRWLTGLRLHGTKNGEQTEVDILALTNAADLGVLIMDERGEVQNYAHELRTVVSSPLTTSVDVAVLLHELGHANQFNDPNTAPASVLYAAQPTEEGLEATMRAIPQMDTAENRRLLERLRQQREKDRALVETQQQLEGQLLETDRRLTQELLPRTPAMAALKLMGEQFRVRLKTLKEELPPAKPELFQAVRERFATRLEDAGFHFSDESTGQGAFYDPESLTKDGATLLLDHIPLDAFTEDRSRDLALSNRFSTTEQGYRADVVVGVASDSAERRYYKVSIDLKSQDLEPEIDDLFSRLVSQQSELREEIRKTKLTQQEGFPEGQLLVSAVREVTDVPKRVMERDATRRAFQWMRKIRQDAGINLFASVTVSKDVSMKGNASSEEPTTVGVCAESVLEEMQEVQGGEYIETDVKQDLLMALDTYKAGTKDMKQRHGGKIPRASAVLRN